MIKVYEDKPEDFCGKVEAAICYLNLNKKILVLRKSFKEFWCVPGGKLEACETPEQGAVRELLEETGITASGMHSLGPLYVRIPNMDYVLHLFKMELSLEPSVYLSDEHEEYMWVSPEEMKTIPLVSGGKEAMQIYLQRSVNNF